MRNGVTHAERGQPPDPSAAPAVPTGPPAGLVPPPVPAPPGGLPTVGRVQSVGLQQTAAKAIRVAVGDGGAEREKPSGRGGSERLSG
jgi:hypothetical protein